MAAKTTRGRCPKCWGSGERTRVVNPHWPKGTKPYSERTGDPCSRCKGEGAINVPR